MPALLVGLLLAASPPLLVVRVADGAGGRISGAVVTVLVGGVKQLRRTDASGQVRFRTGEGLGNVAVSPPPAFALEGPATVEVRLASGTVASASFTARARRALQGRVFLDVDGDGRFGAGDVPLPGVVLAAGSARAESDAQGTFLLEIPERGDQGRLRLQVADDLAVPGQLGASVELEVPAAPSAVSRDLPIRLPAPEAGGSLAVPGKKLHLLPPPPAARPVEDWVAGKALSGGEVDAIERLCALANLDPAFRLVLLAPAERPEAVARSVKAATLLQRYLTGPGLVARERIEFAVARAELAPPGQLTLRLARAEEGGQVR